MNGAIKGQAGFDAEVYTHVGRPSMHGQSYPAINSTLDYTLLLLLPILIIKFYSESYFKVSDIDPAFSYPPHLHCYT